MRLHHITAPALLVAIAACNDSPPARNVDSTVTVASQPDSTVEPTTVVRTEAGGESTPMPRSVVMKLAAEARDADKRTLGGAVAPYVVIDFRDGFTSQKSGNLRWYQMRAGDSARVIARAYAASSGGRKPSQVTTAKIRYAALSTNFRIDSVTGIVTNATAGYGEVVARWIRSDGVVADTATFEVKGTSPVPTLALTYAPAPPWSLAAGGKLRVAITANQSGVTIGRHSANPDVAYWSGDTIVAVKAGAATLIVQATTSAGAATEYQQSLTVTSGTVAFNDQCADAACSNLATMKYDTILVALAAKLVGDTIVLAVADSICVTPPNTTPTTCTSPSTVAVEGIAADKRRPRRLVNWRTPEGVAIIQAWPKPSPQLQRLKKSAGIA